ncbi:MAG TPA: SpoIIE family protein phosphatase [Vicinamibacterales bacterium]
MPSRPDPEAGSRRARLPAPLPLLRPAPDRPADSLRRLLFERWPGRVLLASLALRLLVWPIEALAGPGMVVGLLTNVARVGLIVSLGYFVWRLIDVVKTRLLWRVRQRLIISYLFIGVVPALLIIAFFLFGGALMFLNVSTYLYKSGINDIVREARLGAEAAAEEIERSRGMRPAIEALTRRANSGADRYPGISIALVPRATDRGTPAAGAIGPLRAGAWDHMEPPATIPTWVSVDGFGGLLAYAPEGDPESVHLVVRAVGLPSNRDAQWGVVVDIPLDETVLAEVQQATGVQTLDISLRNRANAARPMTGRVQESSNAVPLLQANPAAKWIVDWVVFLDFLDWNGGDAGAVSIGIRVAPQDVYERISSAQSRLLFGMSVGELTIAILGIIAVLFFVIESAALVMGLALARSITGSIHGLFVGTERLRHGDLAHRIPIRSRDQLGELAESFNAMTANIEELLEQAAQKKRLEEELRIAREIQMSLLPRDTLRMPGLAVTALCVPAREVGGDYYDFFSLDDRRVGFLIADVAGKGTSAALYMAELKGLVLSLSKICQSPRQLLIEVNRIISANLDSRSFITMTYAIVDLERRTFTCARAGHTPVIHLAGSCENRRAHVHAPSGMVVGLKIPGIEERFESLLEELTLPLDGGDIFVLFTDGVTEAMNLESDLFGEERLRTLIEEHAALPSDGLRERILREVEAFVGEADPHDDMTMILLKVETPEAQPPATA